MGVANLYFVITVNDFSKTMQPCHQGNGMIVSAFLQDEVKSQGCLATISPTW